MSENELFIILGLLHGKGCIYYKMLSDVNENSIVSMSDFKSVMEEFTRLDIVKDVTYSSTYMKCDFITMSHFQHYKIADSAYLNCIQGELNLNEFSMYVGFLLVAKSRCLLSNNILMLTDEFIRELSNIYKVSKSYILEKLNKFRGIGLFVWNYYYSRSSKTPVIRQITKDNLHMCSFILA